MQQARGSQFDMTPFSTPGIGISPQASHMVGILVESGSPSSRPAPPVTMPQQTSQNFDELVPAASGSFREDDVLAASEGVASGNRWPRQETLALLKIRSDMDATFRDATLKAPLWDEVARKLAELGYKRSAKKCKEKFENVHKYYKRTKEGRAGRQDGKSYRFFTELDALHRSGAAAPTATAVASVSTVSPTAINILSAKMVLPSNSAPSQPRPLAELNPVGLGDYLDSAGLQAVAAAAAGISFSSNSSSSGSDDEDSEEACGRESGDGRKRKREGLSGSNNSEKMAAFFDRLMKQVMERQESMQQKFLEMIEKREQDRMIREEAWRRQEMARLNREQELLAQERAIAASRDAVLLSYLQNIMKTSTNATSMPSPPTLIPQVLQQKAQPPATTQPVQQQPLSPQPAIQPQEIQQLNTENLRQQQCTELVAVTEQQEKGGRVSFEPASSSRWPKAEIHDLINLRSSLESRYQEAGPKGPLWEDISAGMQRLGYNRSAKRCKEKWENINKYFKKVKESSKKRPEDAKTCPYFHQLDALYRRKQHGAGIIIRQQMEIETNSNPNVQPQTPAQQPQIESDGKNHNENSNKNRGNSESGGVQVQTSNGGVPPCFIEEGVKKPEDIVKEVMGQRQQQTGVMEDYNKMDELDSDDMDQDFSDDDNEDEEGGDMRYKIQYQRPNVTDNGGNNTSTAAATANAGSFLTIVQ